MKAHTEVSRVKPPLPTSPASCGGLIEGPGTNPWERLGVRPPPPRAGASLKEAFGFLFVLLSFDLPRLVRGPH